MLEETAYEEIERDFQEVLNELSGDRSLEKFRVEYEKLHAVMKKSYDNEKRLMAKCRELNAEIVVNSAKVATALKLSQDDQTTIASLKKVSHLLEKEPWRAAINASHLQNIILSLYWQLWALVKELLSKNLHDLCIH